MNMTYKKIENGKTIYSNCKAIELNGIWISNPTAEQIADAGWVENVAIVNEPSEDDMQRAEYEQMLEESREKLLALMESYFAENGSGELQEVASERVAIRASLDSLGKIVQTEGDGTAFNPFKTWTSGTAVKVGEWWQTDDGYIWEAKKDGVPTSSTDSEYWDIVE